MFFIFILLSIEVPVSTSEKKNAGLFGFACSLTTCLARGVFHEFVTFSIMCLLKVQIRLLHSTLQLEIEMGMGDRAKKKVPWKLFVSSFFHKSCAHVDLHRSILYLHLIYEIHPKHYLCRSKFCPENTYTINWQQSQLLSPLKINARTFYWCFVYVHQHQQNLISPELFIQ